MTPSWRRCSARCQCRRCTANLFWQSIRQLFARFWRTCEYVLASKTAHNPHVLVNVLSYTSAVRICAARAAQRRPATFLSSPFLSLSGVFRSSSREGDRAATAALLQRSAKNVAMKRCGGMCLVGVWCPVHGLVVVALLVCARRCSATLRGFVPTSQHRGTCAGCCHDSHGSTVCLCFLMARDR